MIISKEQWEEYQELKEVAEEYKQISIMHYNRPYAKRYLKESKERYKKETGKNLLYPDSEEIYKNYYKQKKEIDRLNNIINELEKWLKIFNENGIVIDLEEGKETTIIPTLAVLDKLQELKGSNEK